jgi:hypothetical protein
MRKPAKLKSKFPHLLWHYTNGDENLFLLGRDELAVFALLVAEAERKGLPV